MKKMSIFLSLTIFSHSDITSGAIGCHIIYEHISEYGEPCI